MRMITIGLTTILAALALANSMFGAVSTTPCRRLLTRASKHKRTRSETCHH
jgi:hypothetical protein